MKKSFYNDHKIKLFKGKKILVNWRQIRISPKFLNL